MSGFPKIKARQYAHGPRFVAQGGRKPQGRSYYIHIQRMASRLSRAACMIQRARSLDYLRGQIADHPDKLRAIIDSAAFKNAFWRVEWRTA